MYRTLTAARPPGHPIRTASGTVQQAGRNRLLSGDRGRGLPGGYLPGVGHVPRRAVVVHPAVRGQDVVTGSAPVTDVIWLCALSTSAATDPARAVE